MENKNYTFSIVILTSLFFLWGFLTCMNDILIPYMKAVFELSHTKAMLVQFSFFGAYFIGSLIYFLISIFAGDPINKIGYKNGIIIGLLVSSFGTAMFYPAANLISYPFFLSALFTIGIGFTILQIAANPYVAILGSEQTSSSRLNLAQGFNSLGTTIAPIIGGYFIFKYFATENSGSADSVVIPYLIFSSVFLLLAIVFYFIKLPRFNNDEIITKGVPALKYRHLVLGMIAIFMYVGAEVSIGSIMISFLALDNIAGFDENHASTYVAFYWGGLMIGRFLGAISLTTFKSPIKKYSLMLISTILTFAIIFISAYLKSKISFIEIFPIIILIAINFLAFIIGKSVASRTLFIFAISCVILLVLGITTNGALAMWAIIGIGLFNSIMWSNIFTLSISGLEKHTSQGSSLLVMMILGGALLPIFQGFMADKINIQISYIIPLIAYSYLIFYGISGYKFKKISK